MAGTSLSAVVGLGFSAISRSHIGSTRELAVTAITRAVDDAGLTMTEIDGVLLNRSPSAPPAGLPMAIHKDLRLRDLSLLSCIEGEGCSAIQMLQFATLAIRAGTAKTVVCVFSDARLGMGNQSAEAFSSALSIMGIDGWEQRYGLYGATGAYALLAQRYLSRYGLAPDAFAPVALASRKWAAGNPLAMLREPMTREDYIGARWIVEPLRLFDCAYPVNGAIAVVVTSSERAADLRRRPAYLQGMGQGHEGSRSPAETQDSDGGARRAGELAYRMAGVTASQIDLCQFYDNFSFMTLISLEHYGLCPNGEAARLAADGALEPGGPLPCNTGGGHLSGFYLQGMTPIAEAVIQIRGDGGERQVKRRDTVLVTGVGGRMDYHAALIMSPHESLT